MRLRRQLRREAEPAAPGDPGWRTGRQRPGPTRIADERVVNLFVIPYQSLKGSTGGDPQETVPILDFASFYVMNWTGSNNNQSDPCPDRTLDPDCSPGLPRRSRFPTRPRGAITEFCQDRRLRVRPGRCERRSAFQDQLRPVPPCHSSDEPADIKNPPGGIPLSNTSPTSKVTSIAGLDPRVSASPRPRSPRSC